MTSGEADDFCLVNLCFKQRLFFYIKNLLIKIMVEAYQVSHRGRVKSAGLTLSMFFEPAEPYLVHPSIKSASEMTKYYADLRKSPPEAVRDRFFPRGTDTSGMIKTGAGLPRTSITTHQGAGQFLVHSLNGNETTKRPPYYEIDRQTGFCILEAHLNKQLASNNYPPNLTSLINQVKYYFSNNDLRSAQLSYEQLIQLAGGYGIDVRRNAQVGREGLFFIHPSIPKSPIHIDRETHKRVFQRGNDLAASFGEIANEKRMVIARSLGITPSEKRDFLPFYFQIDFLLKNDGSVEISDVNIPDVGFFLISLDHEGNETINQAQNTVRPQLNEIVNSIRENVIKHQSKTVNLITRRSVLENYEDTLEIKEIEVLCSALESLGITTQVVSQEQALELNENDLGILMNIDTESDAFKKLLEKRLIDESVPIYPDPYLLLAKNELTDHQQITLNKDAIDSLREAFVAVERASNPGKDYALVAAVNQMFHNSGLPDDCSILHLYIPGQPTPIPFYRYDVRGIQIALNYVKDVKSVVARAIPVSPDNVVLFDNDQKPVYSVFRYMFYQ
ncbi:hypothetical protein CO166_01035 [Candidatus Roizmanbacteria bacterium CG_4_9_14_3_um_filter_36_11]|nr:MAG: hypothetical protein CO166_01035 [Candidatus Roizmanbacteria bacterium CG_4_9_14_3_um_filter_36_11]